MASSEAHELALLLTLKDKASKGISSFVRDLQKLKSEVSSLNPILDKLNKAMGGGGASGGIRNIVRGQQDVTRAMQGQTRLQADLARLGAAQARQTGAQARAISAMNSAESSRLRAKQQGVRLTQQELRLQQQIERASRPRPRWSGGGGSGIAGAVVGAGAAYAGGAYLARGYRDSTTLEDARVNLRSTITKTDRSGKFDALVRDRQMGEFNRLGTELGNRLPGDTMQYLDMFSGLKQRGLQVEDVLSGAGKATAYLSVANKADPRQTAQDVAQFGNIYGLKGKEYERSTDLLSRINTSKGLEAGELIESSKYFQGRAGAPLGLKGLEGAEQSTRYLAFMRQTSGMEGSAVGTASGTFLTNLIKKPKELAALSKATGIDLKPTDNKGKFIGLEPLMEKFAKLDGKLTNEQQVKFGNKIAGEEGSAIFSAMVTKGKEFKEFNRSIDSTIGMFAKVDALTGTTASKMEALQGTYANFNAELFGALTKSLDPLIDRTNTYLGQLQGIAAQHQNVASFTGGIIGIGTAALGATPYLSDLIRAITGAGGGTSGGGSTGVLGTGIDLPEAAAASWAGGKVLKYGKGLLRAGAVPLAGATVLGGIGYGIYNDSRTRREAEQSATERFAGINTARQQAGGVLPKTEAARIAAEAAAREKLGVVNPSWVSSLRGPAIGYLGATRPNPYGPQRVSEYRKQFPEYQLPEVMRDRVNRVRGEVAAGTTSPAIGENYLSFLQKVFPDAYKQATLSLAQELSALSQQATPLEQSFNLMMGTGNKLSPAFQRSADAAHLFADRVNSLQLPTPHPTPGVPQSASGSVVQGDGLVSAHRGNVIFPAKLSRHAPGDWLDTAQSVKTVRARGGGGEVHIGKIEVNVPAGSRAADDPERLGQAIAVQLKAEIAELKAVVYSSDYIEDTVSHGLEIGMERS